MSGGLGKTFNSHTVSGRANVGKATYATLAVGYVLYRLLRKPKAPPPPPGEAEEEDFFAIKEPECECGCTATTVEDDDKAKHSEKDPSIGEARPCHENVKIGKRSHNAQDVHFPQQLPQQFENTAKYTDEVNSAYITYKSIQILLNNQLRPEELVELQKQQEIAWKVFERAQAKFAERELCEAKEAKPKQSLVVMLLNYFKDKIRDHKKEIDVSDESGVIAENFNEVAATDVIDDYDRFEQLFRFIP